MRSTSSSCNCYQGLQFISDYNWCEPDGRRALIWGKTVRVIFLVLLSEHYFSPTKYFHLITGRQMDCSLTSPKIFRFQKIFKYTLTWQTEQLKHVGCQTRVAPAREADIQMSPPTIESPHWKIIHLKKIKIFFISVSHQFALSRSK